MDTWTCKCGEVNAARAEFCGQCGSRSGSPSEREIRIELPTSIGTAIPTWMKPMIRILTMAAVALLVVLVVEVFRPRAEGMHPTNTYVYPEGPNRWVAEFGNKKVVAPTKGEAIEEIEKYKRAEERKRDR